VDTDDENEESVPTKATISTKNDNMKGGSSPNMKKDGKDAKEDSKNHRSKRSKDRNSASSSSSRSRSRSQSQSKTASASHRNIQKNEAEESKDRKNQNTQESQKQTNNNSSIKVVAANPPNKRSLLWSAASQSESATKKWETLAAETEDQAKFLKLMGVKNVDKLLQKPAEEKVAYQSNRKEIVLNPEAKEQMNYQLERQYEIGLKRKDGRKTGLGSY